jgi:hypothetical protein
MKVAHRDLAHVRDLSRDEVLTRIRDGVLAALEDVVGIVVFGSF